MRVNKLQINVEKTKVLWVSRKAVQRQELSLHHEVIPYVKCQVHSLGGLLVTAVTSENQVPVVALSAFVSTTHSFKFSHSDPYLSYAWT